MAKKMVEFKVVIVYKDNFNHHKEASLRSKNIHMILFIGLLVISMCITLSAQQGRGAGRVRGTVQDEEGNPLAGVKIVAQHLKYNTQFESESGNDGNWAIAGLGTGLFRFTTSLEGYENTVIEKKISQFSRNNPPIHLILKKAHPAQMGMPSIQDESSIPIFEEGNQLYHQGRYAEALKKFEEFLEKNSSIYQVSLNMGSCYRQMGEYDKALSIIQQFLDRVRQDNESIDGNEDAAKALIAIGEIYLLKGELDKASEYLTEAIEIHPKDEVLAFNIGEIYFKQKQIDKAIKHYKLSTQINENWAPSFRQLGYAHLNKGEYKLAIDSFKKFLELDPDNPQASTIKNLIPKLEEYIKE